MTDSPGCWRAGVIICGHTQLLAAKKLGLKQVPVHVAANLTPAQVKAYRLMDNRSHEEAEWDTDLLGPTPSAILLTASDCIETTPVSEARATNRYAAVPR